MPEPNQQPTEQKVVFEFQHTDEQGNPIIDPRTGKQGFTNLTGANYQEIAEKMRDSYINVNRAYARARSIKAVPKESEPARKELSAEEERQAAADLQDPTKARAGVRKLAGVEDIEARQKSADDAKFAADAKAAAYQFMSRHMDDYYPCQANSVELSRYINEQELDPRVEANYEIAFNAVGNLLAPRPQPNVVIPPANDPAPPPARATSGGIQPGELTGNRPTRRPKNEITRESINEMRRTPLGRAEYKKRMRDPAFVAAVNAAFQT